jgi:hypothetical protein
MERSIGKIIAGAKCRMALKSHIEGELLLMNIQGLLSAIIVVLMSGVVPDLF